jgi:hypothetical protein
VSLTERMRLYASEPWAHQDNWHDLMTEAADELERAWKWERRAADQLRNIGKLSDRHLELAQAREELLLRVLTAIPAPYAPGSALAAEIREHLGVEDATDAQRLLNEHIEAKEQHEEEVLF